MKRLQTAPELMIFQDAISTRCPKACDKCRQTAPELKEVAPGHYVACHLYE